MAAAAGTAVAPGGSVHRPLSASATVRRGGGALLATLHGGGEASMPAQANLMMSEPMAPGRPDGFGCNGACVPVEDYNQVRLELKTAAAKVALLEEGLERAQGAAAVEAQRRERSEAALRRLEHYVQQRDEEVKALRAEHAGVAATVATLEAQLASVPEERRQRDAQEHSLHSQIEGALEEMDRLKEREGRYVAAARSLHSDLEQARQQAADASRQAAALKFAHAQEAAALKVQMKTAGDGEATASAAVETLAAQLAAAEKTIDTLQMQRAQGLSCLQDIGREAAAMERHADDEMRRMESELDAALRQAEDAPELRRRLEGAEEKVRRAGFEVEALAFETEALKEQLYEAQERLRQRQPAPSLEVVEALRADMAAAERRGDELATAKLTLEGRLRDTELRVQHAEGAKAALEVRIRGLEEEVETASRGVAGIASEAQLEVLARGLEQARARIRELTRQNETLVRELQEAQEVAVCGEWELAARAAEAKAEAQGEQCAALQLQVEAQGREVQRWRTAAQDAEARAASLEDELCAAASNAAPSGDAAAAAAATEELAAVQEQVAQLKVITRSLLARPAPQRAALDAATAQVQHMAGLVRAQQRQVARRSADLADGRLG
eukprot:TRINITY_DN30636_c0_g1_i1.p1 TRINITY_DN30636_c0_g1~~TRINITY_DN30636_c0_g1_i1.p1  ORF type:complete len:616 (+),score=229.98 TRINITY_DN30636_c0_g1_i1:73-1920(+)